MHVSKYMHVSHQVIMSIDAEKKSLTGFCNNCKNKNFNKLGIEKTSQLNEFCDKPRLIIWSNGKKKKKNEGEFFSLKT